MSDKKKIFKGIFTPIQELGETLRNSSGNLMLVEHYTKKIEISVKNIIDWAKDIKGNESIASKIKSNAETALKDIEGLKKEFD
jgi:hypothetical protein